MIELMVTGWWLPLTKTLSTALVLDGAKKSSSSLAQNSTVRTHKNADFLRTKSSNANGKNWEPSWLMNGIGLLPCPSLRTWPISCAEL